MNLENAFGGEDAGIKVLDRTALILDIFAQHAQTREGKLQVTCPVGIGAGTVGAAAEFFVGLSGRACHEHVPPAAADQALDAP
jgi:hypothetical protein